MSKDTHSRNTETFNDGASVGSAGDSVRRLPRRWLRAAGALLASAPAAIGAGAAVIGSALAPALAPTEARADTVWLGTVNNAWALANNWSNGLPSATNPAVFESSANVDLTGAILAGGTAAYGTTSGDLSGNQYLPWNAMGGAAGLSAIELRVKNASNVVFSGTNASNFALQGIFFYGNDNSVTFGAGITVHASTTNQVFTITAYENCAIQRSWTGSFQGDASTAAVVTHNDVYFNGSIDMKQIWQTTRNDVHIAAGFGSTWTSVAPLDYSGGGNTQYGSNDGVFVHVAMDTTLYYEYVPRTANGQIDTSKYEVINAISTTTAGMENIGGTYLQTDYGLTGNGSVINLYMAEDTYLTIRNFGGRILGEFNDTQRIRALFKDGPGTLVLGDDDSPVVGNAVLLVQVNQGTLILNSPAGNIISSGSSGFAGASGLNVNNGVLRLYRSEQITNDKINISLTEGSVFDLYGCTETLSTSGNFKVYATSGGVVSTKIDHYDDGEPVYARGTLYADVQKTDTEALFTVANVNIYGKLTIEGGSLYLTNSEVSAATNVNKGNLYLDNVNAETVNFYFNGTTQTIATATDSNLRGIQRAATASGILNLTVGATAVEIGTDAETGQPITKDFLGNIRLTGDTDLEGGTLTISDTVTVKVTPDGTINDISEIRIGGTVPNPGNASDIAEAAASTRLEIDRKGKPAFPVPDSGITGPGHLTVTGGTLAYSSTSIDLLQNGGGLELAGARNETGPTTATLDIAGSGGLLDAATTDRGIVLKSLSADELAVVHLGATAADERYLALRAGGTIGDFAGKVTGYGAVRVEQGATLAFVGAAEFVVDASNNARLKLLGGTFDISRYGSSAFTFPNDGAEVSGGLIKLGYDANEPLTGESGHDLRFTGAGSSFSAKLTGDGALILEGAEATLNLAQPAGGEVSDHTGGVIVRSGTLSISSNAALGPVYDPVVRPNARLVLGDADAAPQPTEPVATLAFTGVNNLRLTHPVFIEGDAGANIYVPATTTGAALAGGIFGSAPLYKTGTGELALDPAADASAFTGGIVVRDGVLGVASDASLGAAYDAATTPNATLTLGNAASPGLDPLDGVTPLPAVVRGTLRFDADDLVIARPLTLDGPGGFVDTNGKTGATLTGGLLGTGALVKTGAGALLLLAPAGQLSADASTGGAQVREGTLIIDADAALGAAYDFTTGTGGVLTLGGAADATAGTSATTGALEFAADGVTVARPLLLEGVGGVINVGSLDIEEDGVITTIALTATITGAVGETVAGAAQTDAPTLTKTGAGTLILTGAGSDYTGATYVKQGTLRLSGNGGTGVGDVLLSGGATLDFAPDLTTTLLFDSTSAVKLDTTGVTGDETLLVSGPGTVVFKGGVSGLNISQTGGTLNARAEISAPVEISGGTFDLRGDADGNGKLTGTVDIYGGSLTVATGGTVTGSVTVHDNNAIGEQRSYGTLVVENGGVVGGAGAGVLTQNGGVVVIRGTGKINALTQSAGSLVVDTGAVFDGVLTRTTGASGVIAGTGTVKGIPSTNGLVFSPGGSNYAEGAADYDSVGVLTLEGQPDPNTLTPTLNLTGAWLRMDVAVSTGGGATTYTSDLFRVSGKLIYGLGNTLDISAVRDGAAHGMIPAGIFNLFYADEFENQSGNNVNGLADTRFAYKGIELDSGDRINATLSWVPDSVGSTSGHVVLATKVLGSATIKWVSQSGVHVGGSSSTNVWSQDRSQTLANWLVYAPEAGTAGHTDPGHSTTAKFSENDIVLFTGDDAVRDNGDGTTTTLDASQRRYDITVAAGGVITGGVFIVPDYDGDPTNNSGTANYTFTGGKIAGIAYASECIDPQNKTVAENWTPDGTSSLYITGGAQVSFANHLDFDGGDAHTYQTTAGGTEFVFDGDGNRIVVSTTHFHAIEVAGAGTALTLTGKVNAPEIVLSGTGNTLTFGTGAELRYHPVAGNGEVLTTWEGVGLIATGTDPSNKVVFNYAATTGGDATEPLTVRAPITGAGSVVKSGTGRVILDGYGTDLDGTALAANTYTGATLIEAGELVVTRAASLASTSGVTVNGDGNGVLELNFDSGYGGVVATPITGTGAVAVTGDAEVIFNTAKTYTGETRVSGSTLRLQSTGGTTGAAVIQSRVVRVAGSGSTTGALYIDAAGALRPDATLYIDAGGALNVSANSAQTLNRLYVDAGAGLLAFNGSALTLAAGGSLGKALTGLGAFTLNGGSLAITAANALESAPSVAFKGTASVTAAGAQWLKNFVLESGATFNAGGAEVTVPAGEIAGTLLAGSLVKPLAAGVTGGGSLRLSAQLQNTTLVEVTGGELVLAVSNALANVGSVHIGSGASLVNGGSGLAQTFADLRIAAVAGAVNFAGATVTINAGDIASPITNASTVSKNGTGTLTLRVEDALSVRTFTLPSGVLDIRADQTFDTFNANRDATLELDEYELEVRSGRISSTVTGADGATIHKTGASTSLLLEGIVSDAVATILGGGTVTIGTDTAVSAQQGKNIVNGAEGVTTLKFLGENEYTRPWTFVGAESDGTGESARIEATTPVTLTGGASFTGAGDIEKVGAATLTLAAASPGYTGSVTVTQGALALDIEDALASAARVTAAGANITATQAQTFTRLDISADRRFEMTAVRPTLSATPTPDETAAAAEQNALRDLTVGSGLVEGRIVNVHNLTVTGAASSAGALTVTTPTGITAPALSLPNLTRDAPLRVDGKLEVQDGAMLSVPLDMRANTGDYATVHADSLVFAPTAILNITALRGSASDAPAFTGSMDNLDSPDYVTLIKTTQPVARDAFPAIYAIAGSQSQTNFATVQIRRDSADRSVLVTLGLAWNDVGQNAAGEYTAAHGEFEIVTDFNFGVMLEDRLGEVVNGVRQPFKSNLGVIASTGEIKRWDGKTLTKTGAGTLIFETNQGYTGDTIIKEGSIIVQGLLGAGTSVVNDSSVSGDYLGNIVIGDANGSLTLEQSRPQVLRGSITGNGSLNKSGAGALTVHGAVALPAGEVTIERNSTADFKGAFTAALLTANGTVVFSSKTAEVVIGDLVVGSRGGVEFAAEAVITGSMTLNGAAKFSHDATIADTFTVADGKNLVIADGVTLTLAKGGAISAKLTGHGSNADTGEAAGWTLRNEGAGADALTTRELAGNFTNTGDATVNGAVRGDVANALPAPVTDAEGNTVQPLPVLTVTGDIGGALVNAGRATVNGDIGADAVNLPGATLYVDNARGRTIVAGTLQNSGWVWFGNLNHTLRVGRLANAATALDAAGNATTVAGPGYYSLELDGAAPVFSDRVEVAGVNGTVPVVKGTHLFHVRYVSSPESVTADTTFTLIRGAGDSTVDFFKDATNPNNVENARIALVDAAGNPAALNIGLSQFEVLEGTATVAAVRASSEVTALVTSAGSLAIGNFAQLDNLGKRLGELRLMTRWDLPAFMQRGVADSAAASAAALTGDYNARAASAYAPTPAERAAALNAGEFFWVRAYAQRANVSIGGLIADFREYQYGADIGFDHTLAAGGDHLLTLGGFVGYQGAQRRLHDAGGGSKGATDAPYVGAYLVWQHRSGFYFDGVLKAQYYDATVTLRGTTYDATGAELRTTSRTSYENTALSGSLEIGYAWNFAPGWTLTPSAQFTAAHFYAIDGKTGSGLEYKITATDALRYSGELALARTWDLGGGRAFSLEVRGGYEDQNSYNGRDRASASFVLGEESADYDPSPDGNRWKAGFGLAWQISPNQQLHADYEWSHGRKYTVPWALNLGWRVKF
ncbi:MAG: autotransporter outer membrane beta-barrel domain-containing protein [Puniceicoccales bacterium]|jgi:outer membrane autotransporter protein|nr:autotransporter outer membrane beta-barrel domain-containing protein [Puniceicoccales bacterium]